MLSDEEKEALERLNKRYEFFKENPLATNVWLTLDIHDLGIVLNLIEKQSKEIEELKEKNKTLKNLQNDTNRLYIEITERKNYFERELQKLEDKIKAKIEELELEDLENELEGRSVYDGEIKVLQSLLEEKE